jgi:hypothetical protein
LLRLSDDAEIAALKELAEEVDESAVGDGDLTLGLIAPFYRRGLLPERLLNLCDELRNKVESPDLPSTGATALLFSCSAYPQRAFQMEDTELRRRLTAFLANICRYLAFHGDASAQTIAESFEVEGVPLPDQLLADLCAADVPRVADESEREQRMAGAALYLATCHMASLARLRKVWETEGNFARFVREHKVASPPSRLSGDFERGAAFPNWLEVRAVLKEAFSPHPESHDEQLVMLEALAWKEARKWTALRRVPERVQDFWEDIFEKLSCGFPYFAYGSRFVWWWRQCLRNYPFSRHAFETFEPNTEYAASDASRLQSRGRQASLGRAPDVLKYFEVEVGKSRPQQRAPQLTPEVLRVYREGYRLVRLTFSPEQNRSVDVLRAALDEIWYLRIEQEDMDSAVQIKEITNKFAQLHLTKAQINNYSHRLRLRMWAYKLSRVDRLTCQELLDWSPAKRRSNAGAHPLKSETAVRAIAVIARAVLPEHTLLWAFAAKVFLQPLVRRPRNEVEWTFPRFVAELWHWIDQGLAMVENRDPSPIGSTERDRADEQRSPQQGRPRQNDRCIIPFRAQVRERGELRQLVDWLSQFKDWGTFTQALSQRAFEPERAAALSMVQDVVGPEGLAACSVQAICEYQQLPELSDPNWIIPVWYLAFAERLNDDQILARLRVDAGPEREEVALLCQRMREFVRHSTAADAVSANTSARAKS